MIRLTQIVLSSILLLWVSSCDVLDQMIAMKRFAACSFGIKNISLDQIAGIDIRRMKSESDLNMGNMLTLGNWLAKGTLPAQLTVGVTAYNPGQKPAIVSGLDWEVLMKDISYGSGKINQTIEVKPGESTEFPVKVAFDLLRLITSGSMNNLLAFLFDSNNNERIKQLDLKLKVRPWYTRHGETRPAPTYITIRP